MKYRKRPVVVEAVLYDGTDAAKERLVGMCNHYIALPANGTVYVTTPNGAVLVEVGDWVIKGKPGDFYPCKPDVFEQVYEKVD